MKRGWRSESKESIFCCLVGSVAQAWQQRVVKKCLRQWHARFLDEKECQGKITFETVWEPVFIQFSPVIYKWPSEVIESECK